MTKMCPNLQQQQMMSARPFQPLPLVPAHLVILTDRTRQAGPLLKKVKAKPYTKAVGEAGLTAGCNLA